MKQGCRGFTVIEVLSVIAVIMILSGIVLVTMNSGKDAARVVRQTDAVAALNEAERSLTEYNARAATALGKTNEFPANPSSKDSRISFLRSSGFLATPVNSADVHDIQLEVLADGTYRWAAPAP